MPPALAIFVKTPGLSPIKTRLARDIGTASAIHFHKLAAKATAEIVSACGDAVRPYWALAEDDPLAFANWIEFPCIVQGSGSLGDRLYRVHAQLRARHGSSLMIGTDIPQINPGLILNAVETLAWPDVDHVLGPANDGGFWLFGSKRPISHEDWSRVPYSTDRTAEALQAELADSGFLAVLQTLTDVDIGADLDDLHAALTNLPEMTHTQRELLAWLNTLPRRESDCPRAC